jgi:hypothetical protein
VSDVAVPTHSSRLARVLGIVMVFVLLGPPVGAIVFMTTTALTGMAKGGDVSGLGWIALFALIYAAPFSYFVGIVPAAAAGLLMGIRQAYFGRASWAYAVAVGLVTGFGTLFLTGQQLSIDNNASVPVILATCLIPTLVCWLVVRGWYTAYALAGPRA